MTAASILANAQVHHPEQYEDEGAVSTPAFRRAEVPSTLNAGA